MTFPRITEADIGFVPDELLVFKKTIKNFKVILKSLEKKYQVFSQQTFTFIHALDQGRKLALEPTVPIVSSFQVEHYQKNVVENLTDKRVLKGFLEIVEGLENLRERLMKITRQHDDQLEAIYTRWSKVLSSRMRIRKLRTKKLNPQMNYLNCDQVRNYFGGVVNILPAALELASAGIDRLEKTRAYKPATTASQESIERTIEKLDKVADRMQKYPSQKFKQSMRGC